MSFRISQRHSRYIEVLLHWLNLQLLHLHQNFFSYHKKILPSKVYSGVLSVLKVVFAFSDLRLKVRLLTGEVPNRMPEAYDARSINISSSAV